jgi:hypothetical protein
MTHHQHEIAPKRGARRRTNPYLPAKLIYTSSAHPI